MAQSCWVLQSFYIFNLQKYHCKYTNIYVNGGPLQYCYKSLQNRKQLKCSSLEDWIKTSGTVYPYNEIFCNVRKIKLRLFPIFKKISSSISHKMIGYYLIFVKLGNKKQFLCVKICFSDCQAECVDGTNSLSLSLFLPFCHGFCSSFIISRIHFPSP